MGLEEIRALTASRTGLKPKDHAPVQKSGPKPKKPLKRTRANYSKNSNSSKQELDKWFAQIQQEQAGQCVCWECGERIPDAFIRHATAHIFPKAQFSSVADHPANYLILGAGCCHDKSHKVTTFAKLKMFKEAVERFLQFERELTKEEKAKKYYSLFREEAVRRFPELF